MKFYRQIIFVVATLTTMLLLSGCGTSRTMVLEPVTLQSKPSQISLIKTKNTVAVSQKSQDYFHEALKHTLYKKGNLQEGPKGSDLTLEYRFVQFDEGSRMKRYLTGGFGNSGEGSMTIQVIYRDKTGKEIGRTQTEGKIGSGFFGGSSDSALTKAAEDVAHYTLSIIHAAHT